jgi:hypothetical protein
MQGHAAEHVLKTAQRKFTTIRISQCHKRLRCLNTSHQHLTASLTSSLPPQDFTNLTSQIQRSANITYQQVKARQKSKLSNLMTPILHTPTLLTTPNADTSNPKDRWLNKSSITLAPK